MEQANEATTFQDENKEGQSTLSVLANEAPENDPAQNEAPSEEEAAEVQADEKKDDSPVPPPQTQEDATKVLEKSNLNITEFENEFMANGELSEDSYAKLEKAGIPKAMVDSYIKGQQAIAEKFVADIKAIAGGEEGYAALAHWIEGNVSKEELEAYNSVMCSGKKEVIRLAVQGMYSRFQASAGIEPKLTHGKANTERNSNGGFQSTDEMIRAMQDKRYGRDAAYTRLVENKVRNMSGF